MQGENVSYGVESLSLEEHDFVFLALQHSKST